MAKKPVKAPVAEPSPATVTLPEGLLALVAAAAEAAKTFSRTSAEAIEKPEDEAAKAALVTTGELLKTALEAIDAWFKDFVASRLEAAHAEADRRLAALRDDAAKELDAAQADGDRQLEEKRAALTKLLAGLDDQIASATLASDDAAPPLTAASPPEGRELVTVIGPARGLRRAGHLFNDKPLPVFVTPEEKALIAADPLLSLTDGAVSPEFALTIDERPGIDEFAFDRDGRAVVKVLGPALGRRRLGRQFGPEESELLVSRDELVELLGDSQLSVIAA